MTQQQVQVVRGYDIRIQRAGSWWMNERVHAWAPAGALPAEWATVTADPTVEHAVLFRSSEARKQSHKRKLTDEYTRSAISEAS